MAEDTSSGSSARRLRQMGLGKPADLPQGWLEQPAEPVGSVAPSERGRRVHDVDAPDGPALTRWRLAGVPAGAAVALLVLAVALVVGLGRGGSGEEVVLGPAGPSVPVPAGAAVPSAADVVVGPRAAQQASGTGAPAPVAAPAPDLASEPPADPAPAAPVVVHVDGAVHRPGVVSLPGGSRVSDAVAAAGGVTDEADTRLVNLARPLQDGELVVVPRPGEQPQVGPDGVGVGAAADSPVPGGASGGDGDGSGSAVDVNRADASELDSLPGIGPVLAQRIVDHRTEVGPFTAVDDLTSVSGIGPAVLERLRDEVTV